MASSVVFLNSAMASSVHMQSPSETIKKFSRTFPLKALQTPRFLLFIKNVLSRPSETVVTGGGFRRVEEVVEEGGGGSFDLDGEHAAKKKRRRIVQLKSKILILIFFIAPPFILIVSKEKKNVKKKNPNQSGSLRLFGFFLQTPAGTQEGRIIVLVIFLVIKGENIAV